MDHHQVKKLKLAEEMTEIEHNGTENLVYHASSQMLNDNEMLVTLKHNGNSSGCIEGTNLLIMGKTLDNQKNGVANDQDTFEIECNEDITTDSSIKIFTVSDHSVIIENLYLDESETGDSNMKTLTILNPVQPDNSDGLEFDGITESVTLSDPINELANDNFIIEQELGECGHNSEEQQTGSPIEQSTCLISETEPKPLKKVKKKNTRSKPTEKTSKNASIDLETLTVPLNEKLKRNSAVQTYSHKKDASKKFHHGQKLYQKIPLASEEEEENANKVPEQISVYDFYDEEEEKCKAEKARRDKERQALKERTCMYCKEVFIDPMDVLRHKREFHKTRKVLVPRKELEPYLKLENRTHCPLCYKEVCPLGYKSVYVKHLMVHCQDPDFTCRVCGIKFKRKDHLRSHEKRHVVAPDGVDRV